MGARAAGCWLSGGVTLQCPGMQSCSCSPTARGCDPPQLAAVQDSSACSWVQGGCHGAGVQVGWEGASKTFLACCGHGGTRGMCLPTATLKIGAVPGIRETGVIQEEAHACIHLSWGDTKEYSIGIVCDVRGLRGTLKYSLLMHYSAPYCLLGLFLKNFWSE